MKKVLNVLAVIAIVMTSCVSGAKNEGYRVYGTYEGTEAGDTIFLCNMQGFFAFVPEDTAVVKEDGTFEFVGKMDGVGVRYICPVHNGSNEELGFADIFMENANIKVEFFKPSSKKQAVIESDGPETAVYEAYKALQEEWNKKEQAPWDIVRERKGTDEEIAAAQVEMDSLIAARHQAEKQFVIDNVKTATADYVFSIMYLSTQDEAEKAELLELFKNNNPEGANYKKFVAEIEALSKSNVGSDYTDFSMPDPEGNTLSISQFVKANKYTLIDFWASWCGPCCAEMPNVVEAYKKFHDKGLEIVGVSLDNNKEAWLKGLERLKMAWPQMSDIKGWECEGAALYAVKAIPANFLIDQNGKIVAKNLREEELHTKLAELLGE